MAARIIQAGETPTCQINKAAATGMISWSFVSFIERAVVRHGTTIKATTAGRRPLKARSTHSLSRTCVKKSAMSKIIRKEGSMVPKAQQIAPGVFFKR